MWLCVCDSVRVRRRVVVVCVDCCFVVKGESGEGNVIGYVQTDKEEGQGWTRRTMMAEEGGGEVEEKKGRKK